MKKIEANIQHVSIFRLGNIYLIGILYDFETDNQEGTLDIIVQGNVISCWIDEPDANGLKKERTAMTTATVHIISSVGPIPVFEVNKGNKKIITVPVFNLSEQDQLKIIGELMDFSSINGKKLSLIPKNMEGLPQDVITELGLRTGDVTVAREWGWRGW